MHKLISFLNFKQLNNYFCIFMALKLATDYYKNIPDEVCYKKKC